MALGKERQHTNFEWMVEGQGLIQESPSVLPISCLYVNN
jgi:hypothetical protein